MYTVLLAPAINPIAVNKYININIQSGNFVLPVGNLVNVNKFL